MKSEAEQAADRVLLAMSGQTFSKAEEFRAALRRAVIYEIEAAVRDAVARVAEWKDRVAQGGMEQKPGEAQDEGDYGSSSEGNQATDQGPAHAASRNQSRSGEVHRASGGWRMTDIEAMRAHANEPVTMPRWRLARLETKLTRAREARDSWRARAEIAEGAIRDSIPAMWHDKRAREERARREQVSDLESRLRLARLIVADKLIERLAVADQKTEDRT